MKNGLITSIICKDDSNDLFQGLLTKNVILSRIFIEYHKRLFQLFSISSLFSTETLISIIIETHRFVNILHFQIASTTARAQKAQSQWPKLPKISYQKIIFLTNYYYCHILHIIWVRCDLLWRNKWWYD